MPKLTLAGKGLAATLVSALLVGTFGVAPAQAVDLVSLDPVAGTTTNTLLGTPLTLTTSVGASINGNASNKLLYAVSNPGAVTLSAQFSTGTDPLVSVDFAAGTTGDGARVGDTSTATSFIIDPTLVTDTGVAPAHNYAYTSLADKTKVNNIAVNTTAITETTFSIYAFVDSNGNKTYDAGTEYKSVTRTVVMKKASDVTATATMVTPTLGGTSIKATVALSGDVNPAAVASRITVQFSKDAAAIGTAVSTAWNDTTSKLEAVKSAYAVLPGTFGAQAKLDGANSGDASYKALVGGVVGTIETATVTSSNDAALGSGSESTIVLRATTAKSVPISFLVKNTSSAVASGSVVTVKVAKSTLDAGSTITAGGKTLTSTTTDGYVTFDVIADVDGKATFTLGSTTAKLGDKLVVSATGNGPTALVSSADATVEWITAAPAIVTNLSGAVRSVAKGGEATVLYGVTDNFGKKVADTGYRLAVTLGSVTSGATLAKQIPVADGKATLTWTDNSTTTGLYVLSANIEKLNTDTGNYASTGKTPGTTTISVLASATPAKVTLTPAATTNLAMETEEFVSVDRRIDSTATAPAYTTGTNLTGSVEVAGSVVLPGTPVTLSAKGLAFSQSGLYTVDSITVYTDSTGAFGPVKVYSHTSGTVTIKATAGTVETTKDLSYAFTGNVAKATLTGPEIAQTQSASEFSVVLIDKWGNPVANSSADFVKFTLAGVGTLDGAGTTYTRTDATGKATVRFIAGANDEGSATITVSVPSDTKLTPVSKTVKVTKYGYASVEAAKIEIVAEKAVRSGNSTVVTVTVLDKDGKPVADSGRDYLWLTLTGTAGSFEGGLSTAAGRTNKDGKATFRVVSNSTELGLTTLSVTVPSVAALAAQTATMTFGEAEVSFGKVKGALVVKHAFVKGQTVKVYVDGKVVKTVKAESNDEGTFTVKVKKGTHVVRVVANGKSESKKLRF